jgi:hypothetical protein
MTRVNGRMSKILAWPILSSLILQKPRQNISTVIKTAGEDEKEPTLRPENRFH